MEKTSTPISASKPLRIAVVGGGIAGLTLAVPLARAQKEGLPIEVHVYEAAAAFTEIGAGVGIGPNAQRLLSRQGMSEYLDNHMDFANAPPEVRDKLFELRRSDPNLSREDSLIAVVMGENAGIGGVHRADFLDSLVALYPQDQATFRRRLHSYVDKPGSPVQLTFVDGTTAEADVLIGCDGVKSPTRCCMFAEDSSHPQPEGKATRAKYSGWFCYRGVVPVAPLYETLGDQLLPPTMWVGYDHRMLTLGLRKNTLLNVLLVVRDRDGTRGADKDGPWSETVPQSRMLDDSKDYNESCLTVLNTLKNPMEWGMYDIPELPWFSEGRVALAGDAAHAMVTFQGAGAGQCIEDTFILSSLLTHPSILSLPREKISVALAAYNHVRRPRATRVQRTSVDAGRLYDLDLPGVMDDYQKIKENVLGRFGWIWEWDADHALQEALDYCAAAGVKR